MKKIFLFAYLFLLSQMVMSNNYLELRLKSANKNDKILILEQLIDKTINNNKPKCIEYGLELEKLLRKSDDDRMKSKVYYTLATLYYWDKKYKKSIKYFEKEIEIRKKTGNKNEIAKAYYNLGTTCYKSSNFRKAVGFYEKSLSLSEEVNNTLLKASSEKALAQTYSQLGRGIKANKMFNEYIKTSGEKTVDEIFAYREMYSKEKRLKEETVVELEETQENLEISEIKRKNLFIDSVKTDRELKIISIENELSEIKTKRKEAELEKQKAITYFIIIGLFIVLFFSGLVLRLFFDKKKVNNKLLIQKSKIEEQNTEIRDSLRYASKIQVAIQPTNELLENTFEEHFVFYKPKDIVSGDFYFVQKVNDYILFTAADSTGHGVPGAFVSMLGISLLNQIIRDNKIFSANKVLNNLRDGVKLSLNQSGKRNEQKDGIDMALCALNKKTKVLQFAGAYNPLIIVRNGALVEYKGDRMPIGIHYKEKASFTNHEIQLQNGDQLYLYSDGFPDQIGGEKSRKYMSKKFKQLLLRISDEPMNEQKKLLESTFRNWRGDLSQVDDVVVLGVKIEDEK